MHPQDDSEGRRTEIGYLSYMLRIWLRRDSKGQPIWSASLEEPGSRYTESFGDIAALFSCLQNRLDAQIIGTTTQQDAATDE